MSVISLPKSSLTGSAIESISLAKHSNSKTRLAALPNEFISDDLVTMGSVAFSLACLSIFAPFSLKPKTLMNGTGARTSSLFIPKNAQTMILRILERVYLFVLTFSSISSSDNELFTAS